MNRVSYQPVKLFVLSLLLFFTVLSGKGYGAKKNLKETLSECFRLLQEADSQGAPNLERELATSIQNSLKVYLERDCQKMTDLSLVGDSLAAELKRLGKVSIGSTQKGVRISTQYNILAKLEKMAQKLFPENGHNLTRDAMTTTFRGIMTYGVAILRQDRNSELGKKIIGTATRWAVNRRSTGSSPSVSQSMSVEDFAYLQDVAIEEFGNQRGGTLVVRAIIDALSKKLEIQ